MQGTTDQAGNQAGDRAGDDGPGRGPTTPDDDAARALQVLRALYSSRRQGPPPLPSKAFIGYIVYIL